MHGADLLSSENPGITALQWLSDRLDPSDSDPPQNTVLAAATVTGSIFLYRFNLEYRLLRFWTLFREPGLEDIAEHGKVRRYLSFLVGK